MMWNIVIFALVGIIVSLMAAALIGSRLWKRRTNDLMKGLHASNVGDRKEEFHFSLVGRTPVPVRKYFSEVLTEGQKMVASVRIVHNGTFNMGVSKPQWKKFSSMQTVSISPPGFLWSARIMMAPGMPAFVHDAYIGGNAVLTAKLFGLITVMESPNSAELAQGELIRYLAEAPWYPTALLPCSSLSWEHIDDRSARLTLVDGGKTVSLVVRFNSNGLIQSVFSDGRYRDADGTQVLTPWEGRFWNYQECNRMLIPLDGEVAWLLPEGRLPYWRGHISDIQYKFVL